MSMRLLAKLAAAGVPVGTILVIVSEASAKAEGWLCLHNHYRC